jgi:hypothetical protein
MSKFTTFSRVVIIGGSVVGASCVQEDQPLWDPENERLRA